ncbi:MAG: PPC domain-containing DNA-binding protein [Spirochaetota bacterium]
MNTFVHEGVSQTIILNLGPGELLKESIEAAARKHDIQAGAVLCGIAALRVASLHHIKHADFPPEDILYKIHQPMEMTSLQGVIIDCKAHCHMQCMSGKTGPVGGHLEEGSEIAYLAEIVLVKYFDFPLERYKHHEWGIDQICTRNS